MLRYLEVILEHARYTFQIERQDSIASTNTWFDGVEHFCISPFVFVQSCNLQHNGAHGSRLIHSALVGGAGEPRGMVIHVADVDNDPGEIALHRNILIPYLEESTHTLSFSRAPSFLWTKNKKALPSLSTTGNLPVKRGEAVPWPWARAGGWLRGRAFPKCRGRRLQDPGGISWGSRGLCCSVGCRSACFSHPYPLRWLAESPCLALCLREQWLHILM